MIQRALPHVRRREPQGNRGRDWEQILERAHDRYRLDGLGVVFRIPNAWGYGGRPKRGGDPSRAASTGDGRNLIRIKSAPDFVGSLRGRGLAFDAKEFAGASIDYKNFDHDLAAKQIGDLYDAGRGGALAGYMVLERRTMRVYWVAAEFVHCWSWNVRRGMPDTAKSLNFSKVVDHRIRLLGECDGFRFDYAPLLIPEFETLKGD